MIRPLRNWAVARLSRTVLGILNGAGYKPASLSEELWYAPNYWEQSVQLALRDLCKPGDVVYDVGANFGGLTALMSRLVGPRGRVYAFEASRRNLRRCQDYLVANSCGNAQLYHAAIAEKSGEAISVYQSNNAGADTIMQPNAPGAAYDSVTSLALDDFSCRSNDPPSLIKLDIEGAEWRAIQGMPSMIESAKPHLIVEHLLLDDAFDTESNHHILEYLISHGYIATDLSTYRRVQSFHNFPQGVGVANVLYIHADRLKGTPYEETPLLKEVMTLDGTARATSPLEPGRYVANVNLTVIDDSAMVRCGVRQGDAILMRYEGNVGLISRAYQYWPFHLMRRGPVELFIQSNATQAEPAKVSSWAISRVENFIVSSTWWLA